MCVCVHENRSLAKKVVFSRFASSDDTEIGTRDAYYNVVRYTNALHTRPSQQNVPLFFFYVSSFTRKRFFLSDFRYEVFRGHDRFSRTRSTTCLTLKVCSRRPNGFYELYTIGGIRLETGVFHGYNIVEYCYGDSLLKRV